MLNITTQKNLLRKCSESFDTEIVKKLRKFQHWAKKVSYKIKNVYYNQDIFNLDI